MPSRGQRPDGLRPGGLRIGDDVETPGGGAAVVLAPTGRRRTGPWDVYEWPDVDLPVGTLVAMQVPFAAVSSGRGRPFLANGWQSWSAPTLRSLGHAEGPVPLRGLSRRHLVRLPDMGDSSNDFLVTADGVAGFTSGGGLLVADVATGSVFAVRRHVGALHPPVWVAHGDGAALLDDLLTRCGGRVPAELPVGWGTWEAFGERFDGEILTRALGGVRRLATQNMCELAVVDDGWQAVIGDWVPDRRRFPRELSTLAGAVRGAGVRAGLWTAPLLVSPRSDVVRRHPEWVARRADGTPAVGADVFHWGGQMWVLDATRADVREYLTELAAAQAAAGFDVFKLDFLYAAADAADAAVDRARSGSRRPGDLLGADTVTSAVLDAIRAGAGEGATLLGCGAPLWPSIGRVDLMRVGPDVTRYFRPHPESNSDPTMLSSLRNGWRASVLRTPFHRRLWGNDPDMVTLSSRTDLSDQQRAGWPRWVAASGQLLMMSDNFDELAPADLGHWAQLVAQWREAPAAPVDRFLAPLLGSRVSLAPLAPARPAVRSRGAGPARRARPTTVAAGASRTGGSTPR